MQYLETSHIKIELKKKEGNKVYNVKMHKTLFLYHSDFGMFNDLIGAKVINNKKNLIANSVSLNEFSGIKDDSFGKPFRILRNKIYSNLLQLLTAVYGDLGDHKLFTKHPFIANISIHISQKFYCDLHKMQKNIKIMIFSDYDYII